MLEPSRKDVIWLIWSRGPRAQSRRGAGEDLTKSMQVTWWKYGKLAIFKKYKKVDLVLAVEAVVGRDVNRATIRVEKLGCKSAARLGSAS